METALGITLELRDSTYAGLYYSGTIAHQRAFKLHENDEQYTYYREHSDHGVILSVNDIEGMDEIQRKLSAGTEATLLRTKVLPDVDEDRVGEDLDPSLPHRRDDLYGFKAMDLDEAKQLVESALGIRFEWDRSATWGWGGFYCVRDGESWDYILYRNSGSEPEHPRFRDYPVILSVDDVADMDEIERKLTAGRTEPEHLRTQRFQIYDDDE
jgi:hypothetical protein